MRELTGRGEPVHYFSTKRFQAGIEQTGATFCSYTPRLQMPDRGPGPFARASTTLEALLDFSHAILADHLDQIGRLHPTRIMFDSFAPWGRFIAERLGLPAIASVPSILINSEIDARYGAGQAEDPRLTLQWFDRIRSRCAALSESLSPPELLQNYGDLNLVYTSRLFQPSADSFPSSRFRFIGPCCDFRPDAPPFPFEGLDGRPLILVSMGTVYERPDFLQHCAAELAGGPWQVVSGAACQLLPQIELLRRAAAFVTHGGMNSVQEALYHGVPMVIAPQAADQFWISARAAELGAAIVVDSNRPASGAIRAAVAEVLFSRKYKEAAVQIGQSLHAAGGAARAAREIQEFPLN